MSTSFKKKHFVYLFNDTHENFSLSFPTFFQMEKNDRDDLLDVLKEDFSGFWNIAAKRWIFNQNKKSRLINSLEYGHPIIVKVMNETPKSPVIVPTPEPVVVAPEKSILIQVPKNIVSRQKPILAQPTLDDILKIQKQFQDIHNKFGLNKTKMIEILRVAVPAVAPFGAATKNVA